jgi:hypothetical protein
LFAQVKSHWPLVSLVSGIALDAQLHSFIVAPDGPINIAFSKEDGGNARRRRISERSQLRRV